MEHVADWEDVLSNDTLLHPEDPLRGRALGAEDRTGLVLGSRVVIGHGGMQQVGILECTRLKTLFHLCDLFQLVCGTLIFDEFVQDLLHLRSFERRH